MLQRKGPLSKPNNALTSEEKTKILNHVNKLENSSLSPWQIVAKLADQGEYMASESTIYRILKERNCLHHRSKAMPRTHKKPLPFRATGPNQIWSWDITFLKAFVKGTFYYLYLPMDIFSRYIVHWEVYEVQSEEYSSQMIERACQLQNVQREQIVLHSDNGGPMKGATMLATLHRLGITPSYSRPRVSDDNPFSEALFKTLKYCANFPEKGFESLEEAREWVRKFVENYNNNHLHSGIKWVTPASKHENKDVLILAKRDDVYRKAKLQNPARWSRDTKDWSPVASVELNPGRESKRESKFKSQNKNKLNLHKGLSIDLKKKSFADLQTQSGVRAGCPKSEDSTTWMGVSHTAI